MCIAILTTPGKILSDEVFRRCWRANRDGFGMAYITSNGDVVIDKGWMDATAALDAYKRGADGRKLADSPMLLHFRAATVGRVTANNCHPFRVKGGAMIHNGTFWHDPKSDKSDSQILAEMMHNQLHYKNLSENKEAFQEAFGYNRVAFLFKDGKYIIFSEDYNFSKGQYGQWKDGIWYSNGGWSGQYSGYYGDNAQLNSAATNRDKECAAYEARGIGAEYAKFDF